MKHRLLVTTALAGLSFFAASPAFAFCSLAGSTWTCNGTDAVGVQDGGQTRTVNVNPGASILPVAPDDAILIGDGTVTVGAGADVSGPSATGIHANGVGNTTITIGNNAVVSGGDNGIYLDGAGDITIGAGADITGGTTAIRMNATNAATASILRIDLSTFVSGEIAAGANGADQLHLIDNTGTTFSTSLIGTAYTGFEQFYKGGTATMALTGTNAQDWTIEGGTLSTTDTASLANVAIGSGTTLLFDNVDGTYADDVTGTGTWDIANDSILTLTGDNNTFTGLLNIDGNNDITIADSGALTGGIIRVNQSTLTFGDTMTATNNITIGSADATINTGANAVTLNGTIAGTGGAAIGKTGSGTLTLGGNNTFDGGLTNNAGTVVLTNIDGAGSGTITNNAALQVGANGTFDNNVAGTGNITYNSGGAVTASGTNTYSGTTTISNGTTLTVNNTARLGDASGTNTITLDNGTLATGNLLNTRAITLGAGNGTLNVANGANTLVQNGIISGAGNLTKTGLGSLTLGGANTYSGTTTLSGGVTSVSAANNLGDQSATNDIVFNGGSLAYTAGFDQTHDVAMTGAGAINTGGFNAGITGNLTGTGALTKNDAGTLTLTGNHTNSGGMVINGGTLALVDSSTRTYNSVISGSGNLALGGTGNITLGGTNTYSGITTISGGQTVTTSTSANLGSGASTNDLVFDDGSLAFTATYNQSRDVTINAGGGAFNTGGFNAGITGILSGAGLLEKNQAGTLTLTGAHTHTGGININAGTVALVDSSTRTYNGVIQGSGNMVYGGTGNITLGGTNTYSGTTTISGGQTVTVDSTDDLGNEASTNDLIFNNGTLAYTAAFDQSRDVILNGGATFATSTFDAVISGDVSGTGGITKTGSGTLFLIGDHSYSGNTVISAGTIDIGDTTDRTYAGNISGAGNYSWSSTGEITLTGNNSSFSGDYIIGNGAIIIGSTNALGTSDIILNGGIIGSNVSAGFQNDLVVNAIGGEIDTSGATWGLGGASTITGTGDLFVGGGNAFSFGATNTMSGGLIVGEGSTATVTGGTGSLGDASATNTVTLDNGTLNLTSAATIAQDIVLAAGDGTINTNANNVTYSGDITGAAGSNLTKTGAGTLTASGNSTYGGIFNINGGSVNVSGTLGDVTINNSGFLRGIGTVGDTIVNSGGTFSPGNSIGTTNVTGDLTFNAGSHYAVEYTTTPNDSDKIVATGNVFIDGGAILDLTGTNGNFLADTNYTIISGASVTGIFGTVHNNLVFLDADFDDSTATDLILTLTRNNTSFADILGPEEQDFANAFDDLANDLTTAFTNLTAAEARAAAESLSNEQQGATTTFVSSINAHVLTGISDRLGHSFSADMKDIASADQNDGTYVAAYMEPQAGSTFEKETNLWFKAIGSKGFTDSSVDDPSQDRYSYGALAGIDRALDDKGFYGFFAGYEYGEVETPAQGASSAVDNYHAGAYLSRPLDNGFIFNAGGALTYHAIDTVRYVVLPGFEAAPQSDTHGYSASGFVELSKPMKAQVFDFAPFANLTLAHTHINGYAEHDGGLANLVVDAVSVTNPITVLGARFSKDMQWGDAGVNLFASLGWQRVFGDIEPATGMRFETGSAMFKSDGAARAHDSALINMGIDASITGALNAYVGYNAAISGSNFDNGVEVGVKYKF